MTRARAADDFDAIRSRMDELRRERGPGQENAAPEQEWIPDAVAHCPPGMRRRKLPERYLRSSCP